MGTFTHYRPMNGLTQTIAFDGSTQSTALNSSTTTVRFLADKNCHVAFGVNPTATTSDMPILAGVIEYFTVFKGDKIAAIKSTESGNLIITEMT